MSRKLPMAFAERNDREGAVLLLLAPTVFGIITGLMLGISSPIYTLLTILGIAGGFFAGLEMGTPLEGFYRGVMGGLLFGFWILFTHDTLFDSAPKAKLPDPEILLVFITLGFGAFLGWLGARMRQRWA